MEALHPDRAAVEARIRAAFAGVTLGKGMSLRPAQGADRYGEGATYAEYKAGMTSRDIYSGNTTARAT